MADNEGKLTGDDLTGGGLSGKAADVPGAIDALVNAAEAGARPSSGGGVTNVAGVTVKEGQTVNVDTRAPKAVQPPAGFRKGQFRAVEVVLTYDGLNLPPIIFRCRMRMSDEAALAHEAFQALPTEARAGRRFQHHLDTLADVIIAEPLGIEDFPPPSVAVNSSDPAYLKDLRDRFRAYFNDPDEEFFSSMLQAAFNRYFMAIVPKEYL
jgi:hypothetical protein